MRTHTPRAANAVRELAVQRLVVAAARRQRDEVLNRHARRLRVLLLDDGRIGVHTGLLDDDNLRLGCGGARE